MKRTQASRCPRMSLSHRLWVLMIRQTPFQCHPAVTRSACLMSQMPEHHYPPRVTFWSPTPLFLVCFIHASVLLESLMQMRVKRPHFSFENTGYVSWRDTQSGSWYIETLDRVLAENAAMEDLVTMLMMVRCSYYVG